MTPELPFVKPPDTGLLSIGTVVIVDGLAGVITGYAPDPEPGYWIDLGVNNPRQRRYWNGELWSWRYEASAKQAARGRVPRSWPRRPTGSVPHRTWGAAPRPVAVKTPPGMPDTP
ncbi:MAG: hypothetical protein NVSMB65_03510 [Chloroflexota bacterium]